MVSQPASPAEIISAIKALRESGVGGLSAAQKRLMARVLVDEAAKGVFDPSGDDPNHVLARFLAHAESAYGPDVVYHIVRDHRARLQEHATQLAAEDPPIASLILYATAIEHWVNAIILTASLRRGLVADDALVVIRHCSFPAKLDWLETRFGFPLAKQRRVAVQRLVDERNAYVHYKWKGVPPEELERRDAAVRQVVATGNDLLDYLAAFEAEKLASDGIATARAIFGVDAATLARRHFRRTG